jgi:hypothetical protein
MTAPDHMFKNVKKATCINGSIHTCDGAYAVFGFVSSKKDRFWNRLAQPNSTS